MNENKKQLIKLLEKGTTQQEAFAFYDKLEPVDVEKMVGKWKGKELPSGHPMDGVLTLFPWYGKQFIDKETVHPLVFKERSGKKFLVNPDQVFKYYIKVMKSKILKKMINNRNVNPHKYDWILKCFRTKYSKARLRQIEYRGKVSTAMIYDNVPIIDVFRKLDNNTVIGVMDVKGSFDDLGYFFILKKVN
ncbi:uncharacterized protein DUF4334 [Natranaerovirga hydrolytica]|uniref:Uncharacterized protein DUF4334 n=1 Tax=Natranaerovirga hydrolytica TaxID=680378 RepID=A0A4R1MZ36_9FIRM|nr:DUF4334 domain-containing protein [Natranaerovirga hydrolytica]TCK98516.1 uncharacterized protein DUF4334 [Natranaerovirga hydrolytica]